MKRSWTIGVVAVLEVVLATWKGRASQIQSQQATPAVSASAPKEPSNQEINDAFVQQISKQIAGHEQDPSGQVFKNIQVDFLKKVPAGRLLLIMNEGYMALMHFSINQQLLKMQNLEANPKGHFINYSTCHHGQIDPMAQPN